mmetsp:Transcript_20560/g.30636  ORF Transcript_20560/g.30636 Transcript_20560/m.30636 type:complete len:141 (+) Transcript_20560:1-423(+)
MSQQRVANGPFPHEVSSTRKLRASRSNECDFEDSTKQLPATPARKRPRPTANCKGKAIVNDSNNISITVTNNDENIGSSAPSPNAKSRGGTRKKASTARLGTDKGASPASRSLRKTTSNPTASFAFSFSLPTPVEHRIEL